MSRVVDLTNKESFWWCCKFCCNLNGTNEDISNEKAEICIHCCKVNYF